VTPEEFVERFKAGWREPQPEGFIRYFQALSHPDVVATQPLLPAAIGPDAYMRSFRNTFRIIKNAQVDVLGSSCTADTAYIESRLSGTIGGRQVSIEVCDRFVLRDDLIYRRHAFFDPTPIVVGILLRPWMLGAAIAGLRG
jgi:hypothetical protein